MRTSAAGVGALAIELGRYSDRLEPGSSRASDLRIARSRASEGALAIELGRNHVRTKGQPSPLELVVIEVGRVDDTPGVVPTPSSSGDVETEVGRVDDTRGVVPTPSSSGDEGKRKSHLMPPTSPPSPPPSPPSHVIVESPPVA